MSEFSCPATFECHRICDALRAQGIEGGNPPEGSCEVPDYLSRDGNEIVTSLPDGTTLKNEKLTTSLLEALTPLIGAEHETLIGVEQVKSGYQNVLDAHINLWTAMNDATRAGRVFTDVELAHYEVDLDAQKQALVETTRQYSAEIFLQGRTAFDYGTLQQYGIVFDDQATRVLNRLSMNAMEGKPTLVVGDKGIAKTKLAMTMAKFVSGEKDPIFISGHGDQTADEFIGREVQDGQTGMFRFKHGKLIDAMKNGVASVIDEVNLADQAITMRLQDVLLRKPGELITLHENGDEAIAIRQGFVVFATANEASERYRHRVVLDPAFRDRFDVLNVDYPDADNESPLLGVPDATYRLAFAAAAQPDGSISKYISKEDLESLVRVAHITQRLYSTPLEYAGVDELQDSVTTTQLVAADRPVMSDCITPRTMMAILQRCATGNKIGMTLSGEIVDAIRALDQGGSRVNSGYATKILQFFEQPSAAQPSVAKF